MADQGSEGLLSPFLRRRRLKAANPFIRGSVLDVGCGAGYLADFVPSGQYVGVDVDEVSLQAARLRHPDHQFFSALPLSRTTFDTVVALAVIEHASDPTGFLNELAARLSADPGSRIICTTPCPAAERIHKAGARLGLFSRHASDEHERLLGRSDLERLAGECGLVITIYRRFLLGGNQICIMRRL